MLVYPHLSSLDSLQAKCSSEAIAFYLVLEGVLCMITNAHYAGKATRASNP